MVLQLFAIHASEPAEEIAIFINILQRDESRAASWPWIEEVVLDRPPHHPNRHRIGVLVERG